MTDDVLDTCQKIKADKIKELMMAQLHNHFEDDVSFAPIHKIYSDGNQFWLLNGRLHRENGPAYIGVDGRQEWYLNGKFHREGGPAIIYPSGSQSWYLNGKRHREDGPAVIYSNGRQYWMLDGKYHREDGPAAIYPNGTEYWYLNGEQIYSMKKYQEKLNLSDEDVTVLILKYGNIV